MAASATKKQIQAIIAADEQVKVFISEAQIKKIFGLMYELAALSSSEAKVKDTALD